LKQPFNFRLTRLITALALAGAGTCTLVHAAGPLPEIRYAEYFDTPSSMPGHQSRNTTTDDIAVQVVESLVALRNNGDVAPMLADSWTISPDGKTYTFKLRQGVTFHNGAPMTSADVEWSFKYMIDPKAEFRCKAIFDGTKGPKVESIGTPTSDVISFTLSRPYALFLQQMANPQCPFAILSSSSVDTNGNWVKPVGTGPYMFSDWQKGQYVLLTKFDRYKSRTEPSDGAAGAKRASANVRFVVIPDPAAQKAALMSGQVDLIQGDSDSLPPKDPRWNVVVGPGLDTTNILLQSRDPLLADVRMRRAIALSLDMPGLVNVISGGAAQYNASFVQVVSRYYDDAQKLDYKKDPAQVKQLLDAVGYHGQVITIQTNKRYPYMYRQAVIVQQMLSQSGIHAELQVLEWGAQLTNFREGKFQIMSFGYSARNDPALMYGDIIGNKTTTPMAQWDSPAAAKLLNGIEGVSDLHQRQLVFDQIHKMMIDEVPTIMSYDTPFFTVVSSKVHGFQDWPQHRIRLFNLTKDN
jgi:peptide/nickel transport system substrate-binding protein